jgi:hypothetical protein
MAELKGLRDYLDASYDTSVFDTITGSEGLWSFHLHGQRLITGKLVENQTYDIRLRWEEKEDLIPKIQIKMVYPQDLAERILPLIKKKDKKVAKQNLEPIVEIKSRHFIKNKTLYPLMMEKEVVFFTLLEGEIIRGIITAFSRFDITMGLKGGVPLTFLRHSIFDVRNKKGRCLLKSTQQASRDWKKSALFCD